MEPRRRNLPENRLTTIKRNARSKAYQNAKEYSELPIDLIFEILSRLPAKSIAKSRCVSKPWASILHRPDFTELYLTRSYARPQLLFAFCEEYDKKVIFFSSPQPLNLDENVPPVVASFHRKFELDHLVDVFSPISGLVFFRDKRCLKGRVAYELVTFVCNLSTGQCFTVPRMKTRRKIGLESCLGYDPVGKHFKVLSMTSKVDGGYFVESEDHQVLTLGTVGSTWRKIDCDIPHFLKRADFMCTKRAVICINGVLYYVAAHTPLMRSRDPFIVCFDVRTEKYSYVVVLENSISVDFDGSTLINYYGKLATIKSDKSYFISGNISGRSRSFEMCVLDDAGKHKWSRYVYKLPSLWRNEVGETLFDFVGVTATNEMLLSPTYSSDPFYVYYYSLERQTMRRVEIQGLNAMRGSNRDAMRGSNRVYTYLDHVEHVELMQGY